MTLEDSTCLPRWETSSTHDIAFHCRVVPHAFGWFVNIPDKKDNPHLVDECRSYGMSESFCACVKKAQEYGCWWINFDSEGTEDPDLEIHKW